METRELGLIGAFPARKMQRVNERLVRQCKTMYEAIYLCINLSPYTFNQAAPMFGMVPQTLQTILKRKGTRIRNLDLNKLEEIEEAMGNLAITQWQVARSNYELDRQAIQQDEPDLETKFY